VSAPVSIFATDLPGAVLAIVAAVSRLDTMGRLFLIAVALVVPIALWVFREPIGSWRKRRAAERAGRRAALEPQPPAPGSLQVVLAELEERAAVADGPFELLIPAGVTLDGRPAEPHVVQVLLNDALQRSRLRVLSNRAGSNGSRRLSITSIDH
jgi:hypothetical protein